MTYIDELYKKVEMFIDNNLDEYALCIDGNWGSGKTYAINEIINKYNKQNKKNKKNIEYISLNGVESLTLSSLNLNKFSFMDACSITTSLFDCFLGLNTENVLDKVAPKINLKDKIKDITALVFDDIERCKCDIDSILGFIDQIKNNGIKIIIILNSEKIEDENKKIYKEIKEKIIGTTIKWNISDEIFKNLVDGTSIKNFDKENLELLKNCLIELCPKFFIDNNAEKNINLRLLKKTIIHTCYVLQYLGWNKNDGKYYKYAYNEIIKNIYVYFHKETYKDLEKENKVTSSMYIDKINLSFINSYFNNGLYFDKEKCKKELKFLLEDDKEEFNLKYDKLYSSIELNNIYIKIKDNLLKNRYPIFTYSNIIKSILTIDYYNNSNKLKEITDIMCKMIEKNTEIIYFFNVYRIPEKQEKYISNVKKTLQKNNKKISLNLLETYINNLPSNNFYEIDEIISKNNYCEEQCEILEEIDVYKFFSQKEIWNKYYFNKDYDINLIHFIHFLFHKKDRTNEDYIKQVKKIISILNGFKRSEKDCAKKKYIDMHINYVKKDYNI